MSDQTANGLRPHRKGPTIEYRIYFAIIFLITLPLTFTTCVLGLGRPGTCETQPRNFISRAWLQASTITPLIFSQ